jgi:ubiquinone biosynthesis accessory factor UbiJ
MATQSPFPFLDGLADRVRDALEPPAWLVSEVQRRVVLLMNHILMQEPEAQARLKRHAGSIVEAHWRQFHMRLVATPAGLLDLAEPGSAPPDLTLALTQESPWELVQARLRGEKPEVRINGDVQFAAEINWLVDHVRWDVEEDLSRLIGDGPAHAAGDALRRLAEALRGFVARGRGHTPAAGDPDRRR